jgi:FkbM family methyltransferase
MKLRIKRIIKRIKLYGLGHTLKYVVNYCSFYIFKNIFKRKLAEKKVHGSKMVLDLENKGISRALWIEGTREELDVEIVKRELKSDMNILEVGANIGYYLLLEGKILNGQGKIFAFEPDPRNIEILKMNIERNNLVDQVKFYPFAVSDKNSEEKFYLTKMSNLSSLISRDNRSEFIKVRTVKIDDFKEINAPINFIRMDIEGYEYEALNGMMETLKRNNRIRILVEMHPKFYDEVRDFAGVAEKLFEIGFYVKYIISAGVHSPQEIISYGYKPIKISREMVHSHGLYKDIKNKDFIKFIKNPEKIIRSVMFAKN